MKRSPLIVLLTPLFAAFLLAPLAAVHAADKQPSKPNIIFLLTDDLRYDDLGCTGNTVIKTPHIDALASRGVLFRQFFVSSPVCAASRASYFTGRVERSHASNFYYRDLPRSIWQESYPVLLRKAGYRTGFVGKFGVKVDGLPRGVQEDFDRFDGAYNNGPYFLKGKYVTPIMTDQAIGFVRSCVPGDQPFCLSVSFKEPHDPLTPDPAYADLYADVEIPRGSHIPDRERFGLPPAYGEAAWLSRLNWLDWFSTPEKRSNSIRSRYRMIASVDATVGKLVAELNRLGVADKTVILFSSDNGFYYGEHGLGMKFFLHDESIRVPLIVVDPTRRSGAGVREVGELTASIDVAPSILEWAGVQPPEAMQGKSFLPLLRREKVEWRDAVFCENLEKERRPMCDGIRTAEWKYIAHFEQQPLQEELYHLANDPHELQNLADDPAQAETKAMLRKRLQAMRVSYSGDPTGFPEWIQTQKENIANTQSYRAQYLKRIGQADTSTNAIGMHWPLESAADESFTLRGKAGIVPGVQGQAVSLDGSSLIETKGTSQFGHGAAGFAFSVWMNAFAPGGDQQIIAAKSVYSLGQREWSVMVDKDGKIRLYVWQGGWKTVEHKTPPNPGDWHQVGVVMRPGEAELWVDGALSGKLPLKSAIPRTAAPLTIGGIHDNGNLRQTFFGALDEARAFDKALSPAEMAALHHPVTATLPVLKRPKPFALWEEGRPVPTVSELSRLEGVEFRVIKKYEPEKDGYTWLHGVALAWHKGKLYASFGHNKGEEMSVTSESRFCVSEDGGKTWTTVRTFDESIKRDGMGSSHGSMLSTGGKLWAFNFVFNATEKPNSYVGKPGFTWIYVLDESTGVFRKRGKIEDNFWAYTEPVKMKDRNWIMSGYCITRGGPDEPDIPPAVAISHGDDLTQWDVVEIDNSKARSWAESSIIVDGARIVNIARNKGGVPNNNVALAAASEDCGRTWTPALPSNLPMHDTKPYSGVLSNGRAYLIATTAANSGRLRNPLTIALTRPGERVFSSIHMIRPALFPEGPGESAKSLFLPYPYATEHEGKLYVGYSNSGGRGHNFNSAELAIIPLSSLAPTPEISQSEADAKQDRTSLVFDGKSPDKLACDTTLRLMPDGSWVMVMLGGGDSEPRPENQVFITRSHDEGKTWSKMEPLAFGFPREGNTIAMVPSELMVHEGRCTLFFATHDGKFAGWKEWMSTSADSCKTWSKPAPAPGRLHDRTFIRNHIVTHDGRILLPFQHYLQGPGPLDPRNGVLISSDGGKTWSEHGNIRLSEDDNYRGWAENNIVELSDGRIAMIIRADKLGGVLYYAESTDGGRTWPEIAVKTDIPNPGSKATLYDLGDDRVALLHNPNPKVRSPLALWVSFDGMKTWPYQRVLRGDLTGRFNYPDGFVSADKKWLHFAFDHNRDKAIHVSARLPEGPTPNHSK